jgi:acyl-lipid Delta6-acetylenase / acyl-lipid (9-3)-desaturase
MMNIVFAIALSTAIVSSWKLPRLSAFLRLPNLSLQASTVDVDINLRPKLAVREALDVRIDDTWYDLSGWRKAHPAGEHWIDLYRSRDATEVMHAFHSAKGMQMLARLPKSKNPEDLNESAAPVSELTRNFRELRSKLVQDGWWNRDFLHEARLISIWGSLFFGGLLIAKSHGLVAMLLLGLANTSAGWIGHDYIHGL